MVIDIILFIVAIVILIKGSDYLVESASKIAHFLGVSEFVIGLTLVSIGTSIPEFGATIIASVTKHSDLVIGNILGSNIANIGLILGIAAIFSTIALKREKFIIEGIFLVIVSLLFFIMAYDGIIGIFDGIILVILFLVYITYLIREKQHSYEKFLGYFLSLIKPRTYTKALDEVVNHETYVRVVKNGFGLKKNKQFLADKLNKAQLTKEIIVISLGVLAIYIGARLLVNSSIAIAMDFGLSEAIIGLVMIAVGTSLPELFVSIASMRKHMSNIMMGNILGSNVANLLLIGGVGALINPISIDRITIFYIIPLMVFMAFLLFLFIRTNWVMRMLEGILFVFIYAVFIFSVLVLNVG